MSNDIESLTPDEQAKLKAFAQGLPDNPGEIDVEQIAQQTGTSRRQVLQVIAAVGVGSIAGGVTVSELIGEAQAQASTSDSDGDVGTPADRVDVFADGMDVANEVTADTLSTEQLNITDNLYDIRDFGAVGDASTDNAQALLDAFSAADGTGGTVYIPTGDFHYSGPIEFDGISGGFDVVGAGYNSHIRNTNADQKGFKGFTDDPISEVRFANFRHQGTQGGSVKQQAFELNNASKVRFENLIIHNWDNDAMVWSDGAKDNHAIGNIIYNCGENGINPGAGGSPTKNSRIVGNHIENLGDTGIHLSVDSEHTTVGNNTLVGCGIDFISTRNATIVNNLIKDANGDGISSTGNQTTCYNVNITGNVIVNSTDYGIVVGDGRYHTIQGNIVAGGDRGIVAFTSPVSISNNLIISANADADFTGGASFGLVYSNSGTEQRAAVVGNSVVGSWGNKDVFIDDTHLSVIGNTAEGTISEESNGDYNAFVGNIAGTVSVSGTNSQDVANINNSALHVR